MCFVIIRPTMASLRFRISALRVQDENDIKWDDLAWGWSSVRSPQWLRSKWWSIKRQVANHKEIPFSGTELSDPEDVGVTGVKFMNVRDEEKDLEQKSKKIFRRSRKKQKRFRKKV